MHDNHFILCMYIMIMTFYTATITTPPSDVTVCTGGVVEFTCVVDRNGTGITSDNVMWQQIRTDNDQVISISGRGIYAFFITTTLSGDTITSSLTVTGATDSNVPGTSLYRCVVPVSDVVSRNATISVVTGTNTGSVVTLECIIFHISPFSLRHYV